MSSATLTTLRQAAADTLDQFFFDLRGEAPHHVHRLVLEQIEPPLLRATLRYCDGNQSRAAGMLGLNRATLRKKLKQYRIEAKGGPR